MAARVIAFLLVAAVAAAQPGVSSISGSMVHESSVTLSGSGFGTKSPAAPILWDNFEDGVAGERLIRDRSAITSITRGSTTTITTSTAHGLSVGDHFVVDGVSGIGEIEVGDTTGMWGWIAHTGTSGTTIVIDVDSSAWAAYSSGGYVYPRWIGYSDSAGGFYNDGTAERNGANMVIPPYSGDLFRFVRGSTPASEGHSYNFTDGGFSTCNFFFPQTRGCYVSAMFRYDMWDKDHPEADNHGPLKMIRISGGPPTSTYGEFGFYWEGFTPQYGTTPELITYIDEQGDDTYGPHYFANERATDGVWVRQEMYRYNADPGELGRVWAAWNCDVFANESTVTVAGDNAMFYNYNIWLPIPANIGAWPDRVADVGVSVDDVYVDNTLARVELGNRSTFAACTHREIQIPTAWSSTSITVDVNLGTFTADSSSVYLFVVDENGQASSGYPVTIGGGGQSTPDIQSATRSGGNAELTWLSGDGGPYMVWLQASGQDVRALATTDTTATLPMSSAATDVTVKDGTSQRRAHIAE